MKTKNIFFHYYMHSILLLLLSSFVHSKSSDTKANNYLKSSNKLVSIEKFFSRQQKSIIKTSLIQSKNCSAKGTKFQQSGNGPAIVGEYIETSFKSPSPYNGSTEAGGSIVWQTSISHPGASYIAPFIKSLDLAKGDTLVLRSPDKTRSWTYSSKGPRNLGVNGGFWGIHIHGDTAILELHSKNPNGGKGVLISRFARGFTFAETIDETRSICTTDDTQEAKCYQNSQPEMYNQARAVARLVKNGNAHCTAWLVGDEGHLLTNEHCITDQAEANQITIEFMAEGADCATDCSSALGCPGTIEATAPTFIKDSSTLDYALILPDSPVNNLPTTYGYMQLRESGAILDEQLYIPQHPAGWGKRIAFESTYPADTTGFGVVASLNETACSGGSSSDIGYWLDTQGGSSGSPVLALDDHKVVALHHCRGAASCSPGGSGDEPNRGVPIEAVITDLGLDLPNAAVCDVPNEPTNISSSAVIDNQISVSWTTPVGGSFTYDIYRSIGDCNSNSFELIASAVSGNSYNDTSVSGGSEYAYKIKTFNAAESCRSSFSECSRISATGLCTLAPTFTGLTQATNLNQNDCSIQLDWQEVNQNCGTNSVFNIYRSTTPNFTPSGANLISSCQTNMSYIDQSIQGSINYHYIVRAEDDTINGAGVCSTGNEDSNSVIQTAVATGPNNFFFSDDLEAGTPGNTLVGWESESGPVTNSSNPWELNNTTANSGSISFFVSDEPQLKDQIVRIDKIITPEAGSRLGFWHRYNTEATWDGGALEYSTDGGLTWFDILDGNGGTISANANRFITNGYDSALRGLVGPLSGRMTWNGDNNNWEQVLVDLSEFSGTNVEFRWRMSCDASIGDDGWYIDDINVFKPSMCLQLNSDRLFINGFEAN